MIFRYIRELKAEVVRWKKLAQVFEEDLKKAQKEKEDAIAQSTSRIRQELVDAHKRDEHIRDMAVDKLKQELEIKYQEKVTAYQQTFFEEMKELFNKEVTVLKETYKSLIDNII